MKAQTKFLILFFNLALNFTFLSAKVEHSIIPAIEKVEQIENIPSHKFPKSQYQQIADILTHTDEKIRIVSFNMLFTVYDDQMDFIHRWPQRLPRIVEALADMDADIIGTQELLEHQVDDLLNQIDSTYEFFSHPVVGAERCGILFKRERFELLESQAIVMPTNEKHFLHMVKLRDLKTGKTLAAFNVHLSFSNIEYRDIQAHFIAKTMAKYAQEMPVLLTGDLNTFSNRLDVGNLPFYDGDHILRVLSQGALKDSLHVSILGHLGPISTFTNLDGDVVPFMGTGSPGTILDHIFVSKELKVLIHAVQPVRVDGQFPSDHMPVIVDFIL